jgi:hypothetical protein
MFWHAQMRRSLLIAVLAALLAAAPADAWSTGRTNLAWATVNVCDTAAHPNEMGVRGAMPGLKRRSVMRMRFRVQYRTVDGRWRTVADGADSGWVKVATGRRGLHDAGWSFEFKPPVTGGAHVLRGRVSFEWRRGGAVVARERRFTQAGHPGTAGADPVDFSAATCEIA